MKPAHFLLLAAIPVACSTSRKATQTTPTVNISIQGKLFTAIYQQKAAEYKALCLQAYNIAHWRLDQAIQQSILKPKAIITDIDETVLDNSANAVHQALQGKDY